MGKQIAVPPVRYALSKGARIAYQQYGDGPVDLIGIPPAAQNIEMAWEWPAIRAMLERFGEFSRYLHFDKRGTGSSERMPGAAGWDERVDDLIAVMDDAGLERAHILGISEGGPMSIMFAHAFPERVESLILFGTGSTIVSVDATEEERDASRAGRAFLCERWGTSESVMIDAFAPSQADNQAFREWFEVYERRSSSPQSLQQLLDLWELDVVSELLGDLQVPVLVQHRVGDRISPIENGRALAAGIPGAKLAEYEGEDHFGFYGDVNAWMGDLDEWLNGRVVDRPPIRAGKPSIQTLGAFAVTLGDEPVSASKWTSRFARQICKRLAVARGWPITREQLIDQLWPDETEMPKLSARLSVHLSGVRKILGTALVSDRQTVRLDLGAVEVDIERFFEADDDEAIVSAFTGILLPDDPDEDWATRLRHECRARFVAAAHRLADAKSQAGDHVGVQDLAFRLLAADRHDDTAHRLLIRAQEGMGLRSEARSAYDAWAQAMAEIDITVPPRSEVLGSP